MLDRSRDLGADAVLIILHAEVRGKKKSHKSSADGSDGLAARGANGCCSVAFRGGATSVFLID